MPSSCCAVGCTNRQGQIGKDGNKIMVFRFPEDPERRSRWVAAIRRVGWQPNDGSRLCCAHFVSGQYSGNELLRTTCFTLRMTCT